MVRALLYSLTGLLVGWMSYVGGKKVIGGMVGWGEKGVLQIVSYHCYKSSILEMNLSNEINAILEDDEDEYLSDNSAS